MPTSAFVDWFLEALRDPDVQFKILGSVVASLFVAALAILWKHISQFPRLLLTLLSEPPYEAELLVYRQRLDDDTFRVRHAWMKEGQTLRDILVPIAVESAQGHTTEALSVVVAQIFSRSPSIQCITVIGGPGAGKSVALRLAARQAWNAPFGRDAESLVPILLTFADYRHADFNLIEALVESLRTRAFHPSKGVDDGTFARRFVEEYLPEGRLLVLVDALDELDSADRAAAAQRLTADLKKYQTTRAIISCRAAAWRGQLASIPHEVIGIADFTPLAIRQFIAGWGFRPPKSAADLLGVMSSQAHIADLARNPLMLTIIAFLYSQPKYRLPDNRAQFYEVCTRALMEEWDQHENPQRANQYDRPHKENVLGQLAYGHLCGSNPEQDISEDTALAVLANAMHQLGLVRADNARMLNEIVLNSGLLIRLPPTGLRFPHQTLLEYFAALHLLRQANPDVLLGHYKADQVRWREVVLLYCGLCPDMQLSARTVGELLIADPVETALAALTDARAVPRDTAEEVVAAAEHRLRESPSLDLIGTFGYLSANPHSEFAERAARYLKELLNEATAGRFPGEMLEALLLAALRRPNEETTHFIIEHLEQLNLARLLPAMGERALAMVSAVVGEPGLGLEKKIEWVDGLRRAGATGLLYELLTLKDVEVEVAVAAGVALARMSRTEEFWQLLDHSGARSVGEESVAAGISRQWRWPFERPVSEKGRRMACHVASCLAEGMRTGRYERASIEAKDVHQRLSYLSCGLYLERGYNRSRSWDAEPASLMNAATVRIVRSVWQKATNPRWARWMRRLGSATVSNVYGVVALSTLIPLAWSLAATSLHLLGWGNAYLDWRVAATYSAI